MKQAASWLASAVLLGAAFCTAPALARDGDEKADKKDSAAAIIGGLGAIGIGVANAPAQHGEQHRHQAQWDSVLYGVPFSPAAGVVCLPNQRQCYEANRFSYSWTRQTFSRSAAFDSSAGSWAGDFGGFGTFGVDLERAREVCIERSGPARLRNVSVDEAKQMTDEWAYVYMRSRPNAKSPDFERWRCAYSFKNGKTDFKRM
jgi:hypothetical protein